MKIGILLGVDFVEPKIDKRVFLIAKALKNAGHEPHVFCWSRRLNMMNREANTKAFLLLELNKTYLK